MGLVQYSWQDSNLHWPGFESGASSIGLQELKQDRSSSPRTSGRTRTCNRRLWRPLLYQLSYADFGKGTRTAHGSSVQKRCLYRDLITLPGGVLSASLISVLPDRSAQRLLQVAECVLRAGSHCGLTDTPLAG